MYELFYLDKDDKEYFKPIDSDMTEFTCITDGLFQLNSLDEPLLTDNNNANNSV